MLMGCEWIVTTPGGRIVAEELLGNRKVQLIEDNRGAYYLRKVSVDDGALLSIAPVHGDPKVLSEARELFPDLLPFGGLPVDAT